MKHPKMNGNVKYECWYISRFTACSCCIVPLITSPASLLLRVTALRSQQEDGRVPACFSPCLRRKQQNLYCCKKKQTNSKMTEFIRLLSPLPLMGFTESSLVCVPSVVEKYQSETLERTALSWKIGLFWMKLIKGGTRRSPVTHRAKMSEDIGTFVLVALLN